MSRYERYRRRVVTLFAPTTALAVALSASCTTPKIMPDLMGATAEKAYDRLTDAGVPVRLIASDGSRIRDFTGWVVINQRPEPHAEITPDTPVVLRVAQS